MGQRVVAEMLHPGVNDHCSVLRSTFTGEHNDSHGIRRGSWWPRERQSEPWGSRVNPSVSQRAILHLKLRCFESTTIAIRNNRDDFGPYTKLKALPAK